jgi:hypothetical protein
VAVHLGLPKLFSGRLRCGERADAPLVRGRQGRGAHRRDLPHRNPANLVVDQNRAKMRGHPHDDLLEAIPRAYRDQFHAAFGEAVARVGRLYVAVTPPDAELLLDAHRIGAGATSYQLFVEPGSHTIRTQLAGYGEGFQWFDIAAGTKHSTHVVMLRAAREGAGSRDSVPQKRTEDAPAGPKAPSPPPSMPTASVLRIVGVAVTGATAIAGGTFVVWSAVTGDEIEDRGAQLRGSWETNSCLNGTGPDACSGQLDLLRRKDTLNTLAWVSLTTSGVIGAATLASLLVDSAEPAREAVSVVPLVAGGQVGLALYGVW